MKTMYMFCTSVNISELWCKRNTTARVWKLFDQSGVAKNRSGKAMLGKVLQRCMKETFCMAYASIIWMKRLLPDEWRKGFGIEGLAEMEGLENQCDVEALSRGVRVWSP